MSSTAQQQTRTEAEVVVNWRLVGLAGVLLASCVLALAVTLVWLKSHAQPDEPVAVAAATPKIKKFADMPLEPPRPEVIRAVPATPEEMKERPAIPALTSSPHLPKPVPPPRPSTEIATTTEARIEPLDDNAGFHYRRTTYYEWELLERLEQTVPALDIDKVENTAKGMFTRAKEASAARSKIDQDQPMRDLLANRADLHGLPVLLGKACQTNQKEAEHLAGSARLLRSAIARSDLQRDSRSRNAHYEYSLEYQLKKGDWTKPAVVPTLVQMLQAEEESRRLLLVALLAEIKGQPATAGLVQRALFDPSNNVRGEAVDALKRRPATEVRSLLLKGLRHPWPAAADHAADALITLGDRDVVPTLVELLDQPDPCAPVQNDRNKSTVPELVKVNHLRNCQLCHAPSFERSDLVRGLIPTPGEPLPVVYYESKEGNFVRADIVYLRQEFSVSLPVENHGKWPKMQRFDYLIRQRELNDEEADVLLNLRRRDGDRADYPQRYAVLTALRGLTEKDVGPASDEWRKRLREDELRAEPSSLVKMNRYR